MSVIAAHKSKISLSKILKTIHNIKAVPGRFEKIGNLNNNAITILDYAHTPDALETCILNVKEQLNCLFKRFVLFTELYVRFLIYLE